MLVVVLFWRLRIIKTSASIIEIYTNIVTDNITILKSRQGSIVKIRIFAIWTALRNVDSNIALCAWPDRLDQATSPPIT
jgi:hypothetical protein